MKIFINWDPLYEKVVCAHKTEEGVCEKCEKIRNKNNENRDCYQLEYDEFELEE